MRKRKNFQTTQLEINHGMVRSALNVLSCRVEIEVGMFCLVCFLLLSVICFELLDSWSLQVLCACVRVCFSPLF